MKFMKTASIVILFILVITFALKNQKTVSLQYYFLDGPLIREMPLYLLIFFSILVGFLIAGAAGVFTGFRLKYEIRAYKKTVHALEEELNSLRNLPITESEKQDEEGKE